jgi:hypothetical protein
MYDHLLRLPAFSSAPRKLDLLLYSVGGVMETPWKIVTMLREFCDEFHVIIPFKAYSGATLLALGADKIWMGKKGELGPIDPALQLAPGSEAARPVPMLDLGVEDVASYLTFLRNRAGLTDQNALASTIGLLAQVLTPPLLGRIERIYSHIRLVAKKLLALCQPPMNDARVTSIVEALTEKTYVHGHGIGRREARQIGLQVEYLEGETEDLVWNLYRDYEATFNLTTSADPKAYLSDAGPDTYQEDGVVTACVESSQAYHGFQGNFWLRRIRKIPPQPVINVNLNLNLPPSVQPAQLPAQIQQMLQQMVQQAAGQIQQMVAQEIARQSPVERIEGGVSAGRWMELPG